MDTITHAISGAVIGAATGNRHPDKAEIRRRTAWGAAFAAFPDIDFLMVFFVDTFTYLNEHRALTHSVVLLPAWAALLGALAASFAPRAEFRKEFRNFGMLAAVALAAHILGDLITSYGTRILSPLDWTPFAFPITFIIDPIFTGILLAGLVVALWRLSSIPAMAAGLLLFAYLGLQVGARQAAEEIGHDKVAAEGWNSAIVVAFPQPLSPMHWSVVIIHDGVYERSFIDLLESEARPRPAADAGVASQAQAAYRPVDDARWFTFPRWPENYLVKEKAQIAWYQDEFEGFREFALLPYVTRMKTVGEELCVWTADLRFSMPVRNNPFEYAMCQSLDGQWRLLDSSVADLAGSIASGEMD
ncbi:MAG: metal-dependent hydrolase [Gammaproteobacteria bacterium]|nr:metal-dependent hydrolase [Gammaproteobacteria bacterium]